MTLANFFRSNRKTENHLYAIKSVTVVAYKGATVIEKTEINYRNADKNGNNREYAFNTARELAKKFKAQGCTVLINGQKW